MTGLEKVVKGLECCMSEKGCHSPCPYNGECEEGGYFYSKAIEDALALLKAQEPIEARLHLCESCANEYPECDATVDGIEFGSGVGNDNVIGCMAYVNRWKAQQPRVMTPDELDDLRGLGQAVYYEDRDVTARCQYVFFIASVGEYAYIKCEVYTLAKKVDEYGITWRCWTAKPDEKTRVETPWKD